MSSGDEGSRASILYEIGPFRLDLEAHVLTRAGLPTGLGARAVAVLGVLVERPHEYVPKARIIDAAWPEAIVEEANLAVQMSAIRRVLAQAQGGEGWIETLTRRGYRFVGPVTALADRPAQPRASDSERSNLPEPLTSFVGRERELVETKRLLPGKRLLTLVGAGGIGKTRLALQLAAEVADAYRHGVWFVDLAPLADPGLVPNAVAQVFGLREAAGRTLTETLGDFLKRRQVLLLLDNCEHLLRDCASLAETLLQRSADLTVVATSREPLQVSGEQVYSLPALSLPDPGADIEAIARSEAVQLFVERARRQQHDFSLTPARAPVVAQLCLHLDGIPLALELAAARVKSLSIDQIRARIDDRFRLLTKGGRVAIARHQTLRATLDWSFDLLTEEERVAWRRLAVFSGGFTLEAAAGVVCDDAVDARGIAEALNQLVTRSLVVADTSGAAARYGLLETMRAYALEKLAEAGESEAVRRRHARYFRDVFERATDSWWRDSDAQWRATYMPELDNVRAALDWALGAGEEPALAVALAGASRPLWTTASFSEGARRLRTAAALADYGREADRARLWYALSVLSEPDLGRAVESAMRAVEAYRRTSDRLGLGVSLNLLARTLSRTGRFDDSRRALAEAFSLLGPLGLPKPLALYHGEVALVETYTGNLAGAKKHHEESLALFRSVGAESAVLLALNSLADTNWALGNPGAAVEAFAEICALIRASPKGRQSSLGIVLGNLAGALTEVGRIDEALPAAREALPLLRDAGLAFMFADHFALRAALASKLDSAARLAGFADRAFAARNSMREPNETRARARLQALLHERFAPDELERLLAEGAMMSEDDACRIAVED